MSENWIDLNFLILKPLLFLAALSVIGISLLIGRLNLVYKRIGIISRLGMLGILGLISVPALPLSAVSMRRSFDALSCTGTSKPSVSEFPYC